MLTAASAVLLALLALIGGMQPATPMAAQITQAPPAITGLRDITQAPVVFPAYPDAPRDRPDPLYLPTLPPSVRFTDRPDPLYIATLPR